MLIVSPGLHAGIHESIFQRGVLGRGAKIPLNTLPLPAVKIFQNEILVRIGLASYYRIELEPCPGLNALNRNAEKQTVVLYKSPHIRFA